MATDYDCWHPHNEHVNVELALKTFRENVQKVLQVLCVSIPMIAKRDWTPVLQDMKVRKVFSFCSLLYALYPYYHLGHNQE